ncbi:MAG: M42 family metallopeptidase [Clostridiales bacterium]|jgi:putative aminopeptidase FrvX|nr:M42 family metallopeptidase [Clostridiales bacterium]
MRTILKKLLQIPSVSGREACLGKYIAQEMRSYFDTVETDALGNIICRKRGEGKKLLFCAHMDEIGFIVTFIEEDGFLRCAPVGGIDFHAAAYSKVVFEDGRFGVLIPEEGVKPEDYKGDAFVVDIGAKSRDAAARLVSVGDCFALESRLFSLAGSRICGRPLDDKLGCAILMSAAREAASFQNDITFVFSVQEEVGLRGARTAASYVEPDFGIAVDVTMTGDTKGAKPMAVSLGKGAAIKLKDKSVICDGFLAEKMASIAFAHAIPVQKEILTVGGSDTAALQLAGAGCRAGCVSIPLRYCHSGVEMADYKDVQACRELVCAIAQTKF